MLQMQNRPQLSPRKRANYWLKLSLAGVVLVVIGAMVWGIIGNLPNSKDTEASSPSTNRTTTDYASGPVSAAATTAAAAANTAPAVIAAGGPAPAGVSAKPVQEQQSTTASKLPSDRMIIRNASLSLQADNVEKLLGDIRALATEQSGVVMQASTSTRNDKLYANITIQVPAAAFDATISRLRQMAYKVDTENTTSQDVTEEFVDTDARVRNLKATEAVYLEILRKATSVNDTLTVQRELSNVRSEIERLQGRINLLQKKSDNSSISISLSPRLTETTKPDAGWDFGKVLNQAWEGSLRGLQGLATVLITLALYGWWVLPLALVAFLVGRFGWKRLNRPVISSSKPLVEPAEQS